MAWVQENIDTLVRSNITPELHSKFVDAKVLLAILAGKDKAALDRLGDPKAGVMFGGDTIKPVRRMMLNGSYNHEFRFQASQTDESEIVERGGVTPVASGFAEDHTGTAETRWCQFMTPVKIRQDTLDDAQGNMLKIADAMEEAIAMGFQRHLEKYQSQFWTATLTSAQQNERKWAGHIGLVHAVSDGVTDSSNYATYGRVDRTVETQLKANVNAAATLVTNGHLATTKVELDLIRRLNIIPSIGGLLHKGQGEGVGDIVITTPDLWAVMATEADDNAVFNRGDTMPASVAVHGFKNPVILKDNTRIVFDKDCPSGELYLLSTRSWSFEIQKGHNFQLGGFKKDWELTQGGEYIQWAHIDTKSRLTCREPWLQTKVTGLTTT